MPELPEVETIKLGLAKSISGKIISDFNCDWLKMLNQPLAQYKAKLKGLKILALRRRAKMLILDLSQNWHVLAHLKMTGQLVYSDKVKCLVGGHPIAEGYECLPNKFTHAVFTFSDQSHLYFNDVRKFGWLHLYDDRGLEQELARMKLGIEPLSPEFTLAYWQALLKKRPRLKIKQFLMDSNLIGGIGNIYSDEVCFYARVRPTRLVKDLKLPEIKLLYQGIKKILLASIKAQGTTFSNFRQADGEVGSYYKQLKVYGRYGEKCNVCQGIVEKIKIGGRTSSYCPKCQS
jgi:formamidopyrimidine-DNA glycosylase